MESKKETRKILKALRKNISFDERYHSSKIINKKILRFCRKNKKIAIYHAMGSELSLDLFIKEAQKRKVRLFQPQYSQRSKRMWFTPLTEKKNTKKQKNINNIHLKIENMDCIFLPIIGINTKGYRLGQGGGYYDYSLSFRKKNTSFPLLIAVGFDFQLTDHFSHESFDIPVDAFISEKKELKFRK